MIDQSIYFLGNTTSDVSELDPGRHNIFTFHSFYISSGVRNVAATRVQGCKEFVLVTDDALQSERYLHSTIRLLA